MTEHRDPPEVHGHRGCRGLLPENTVPAFLKAAELGCDWIEMDVVASGDGQLVVSHEPWMSHRICLDANGDSIAAEHERLLNIHAMAAADLVQFDCGSRPHPDFPQQERVAVSKPLLSEAVRTIEEHVISEGLRTMSYNIEVKSDPDWYGRFQPHPEAYATLVVNTIDSLGINDRCLLQSFDPAMLEALHALDPDLDLALLVENNDDVATNLGRLSFTPAAYSPWFGVVDDALVRHLRERDIQLVVWTVNQENDMQRMIDLGVDGIITDHPDRLLRLLERE